MPKCAISTTVHGVDLDKYSFNKCVIGNRYEFVMCYLVMPKLKVGKVKVTIFLLQLCHTLGSSIAVPGSTHDRRSGLVQVRVRKNLYSIENW